MMKYIDNILKYTPLITFFVIVASSFKLFIYYSVFNINIVHFIGISEYIPLFMEDFNTILIFIVYTLLGIVKGGILPRNKKENVTNTDNNGKLNFSDKDKKYIRIIFFILAFVILTFSIIYYFTKSKTEWLEHAFHYLFWFMLLILFIGLTYEKLEKIFFVAWIILLIFSPFIINGYINAYSILENKIEYDYTLKINEKEIKTDNNIHYLGKTENYIFLYEKKSKQAIILPISNLNEIRIIKKSKKCSFKTLIN